MRKRARTDRALSLPNEAADYGHLVLRLMGCLVLFYTLRVICKGRLTMEIDQSCNLRRIYVDLFKVSSSSSTRWSWAPAIRREYPPLRLAWPPVPAPRGGQVAGRRSAH